MLIVMGETPPSRRRPSSCCSVYIQLDTAAEGGQVTLYDLGCGDGRLLVEAASRSPNVRGVRAGPSVSACMAAARVRRRLCFSSNRWASSTMQRLSRVPKGRWRRASWRTRCVSRSGAAPARPYSRNTPTDHPIPPRILDLCQIKIVHGNVLDTDLSAATHIFVYLVPKGLAALAPRLSGCIARGVPVVSYGEPHAGGTTHVCFSICG
jgi:hypothetical protein